MTLRDEDIEVSEQQKRIFEEQADLILYGGARGAGTKSTLLDNPHLEPSYRDRLDNPYRLDNPFYSNHVFTEKDFRRVELKLDLWERFCLLFRPTYVQLMDGYVFFYKTRGGRYYLIKETEVKHYGEGDKRLERRHKNCRDR